jgi:transposase
MLLTLAQDERAALEAAQQGSQKVRQWRRYQAVLLRADGVPVAVVARTLGCTQTSVYNWTAAWRQEGLAGVAEGQHRGAQPRLDGPAHTTLEALLTEGDPQAHGYTATGWTVPLLRTELAQHGWRVAERTIRRTLHRLGWRWKRPKYVLGRPDPAYAEKKSRRSAGGRDGGGGRGSLVRR